MSLNLNTNDETNDYSEPFYEVDEEEAKEIDSCLNFLSILEEEKSNDSCNFTLFRKKDETQNDLKSNTNAAIIDEDDSQTNGEHMHNKLKDDAICRTASPSLNNILDKDKVNYLKDDIDNSKNFQDSLNKSSSLKENVHESKDFNYEVSLADTKLSNATSSQNIKIIGPKGLKLASTSIIMPVTKYETLSRIKKKDFIILKVKRPPIKPYSDLTNRLLCSSNASPTKLNLKNQMKLVSSSDNQSQNTDIEVIDVVDDDEQKRSKIKNNTSKECVSLSSVENSISWKLKDIENKSCDVLSKMSLESNLNISSVIKTIKVFTSKQNSNQLTVAEESHAELSLNENAVISVNDNNSENKQSNSLEDYLENFSDKNELDFVSSNPYNAVEIIKKPLEKSKLNPHNDKSKVKLRVWPGRRTAFRVPRKKKKTTKTNILPAASSSLKQVNKKSFKKLDEIYAPLSRTELPSFMKQFDPLKKHKSKISKGVRIISRELHKKCKNISKDTALCTNCRKRFSKNPNVLLEQKPNTKLSQDDTSTEGFLSSTEKFSQGAEDNVAPILEDLNVTPIKLHIQEENVIKKQDGIPIVSNIENKNEKKYDIEGSSVQDIIDDKSQSSVTSLHEDLQPNITNTNSNNTSIINVPKSLNTKQDLVHDSGSSNITDQLIDHDSYCQNKEIKSSDSASIKNKSKKDVFSTEKNQLGRNNGKTTQALENLLDPSEDPLSLISEETGKLGSNSYETTDIFSDTSLNIQNGLQDISQKFKNAEVNENVDGRNSVLDEIAAPLVCSFNQSSSLTFVVQNILENMFKYESFPSSTNMARLGKIVGAQWRDIRDWFAGKREYIKKSGIFLRNQSLSSCSYCPNYTCSEEGKAIVHLLSREHIENMMVAMEKYNSVFTKIKDNKFNELHDIKVQEINVNSAKKLDSSFNYDKKEIKDRKIDVLKRNMEKNYVLKNLSLPSKPSTLGENPVRDNVFKKPMIPMEKLRNDIRKRKNIDSKIYIGYKCPICLKIFSTEWMLIRHSISHRKLICSECNEVFAREDLLKHHFKQHIIESMDDDLYASYVCTKCSNLNCVCEEDTHSPPVLNYKQYVRPQMAKRSKPFRSKPYSGVNEHLKVTMDDFWQKYKTRKQKPGAKKDKLNLQVTPTLIKNKLGSKPKEFIKQDKKANSKVCSAPAPTYTTITTFNCPICESFFFAPDELKEHITVHRIQARNRSNKRSHKNDFKESKRIKYAKVTPSSSVPNVFICYYCRKCFKAESILIKHAKLSCKSIPTHLKIDLLREKSVFLEKINNSNRYKVRVKAETSSATKVSLKSPPKIKCDTCSLEILISEVECHKRVCSKNQIEISNKSLNKSQKDEIIIIKDELEANSTLLACKDENQLHYYLCKYCEAPLDTQKALMLHVKESCYRVPNEILSELEAQRLSSIEICAEKYFTKIERKDLLKVLSISKIQIILDECTFLNVQKNYKRVKCKFCDKVPLKSCLKLHLMKQCKHVPQELQNLMDVYRKAVFNSQMIIDEPVLGNKFPEEEESEINEREYKSSTKEEPQNIEASDSNLGNDVLFDCHLCEEKFKVSKDFITHMQNFHCMSISEESAYKWLTNTNSDDDLDTEVEMKNENTEEITKDGEENATKNDLYSDATLIKNHIQEKLVFDTIDTEIIEESLLGDYVIPQEEASNSSFSSSKSVKIISPINTPSKSQLEEDDLLNDLTNLDNFVEIVQLEDLNFETS